jgi:hypothetical protein
MKPTLRDYLTIAASLIVIFACGYGIGHLVGLRKQPAEVPPTPATTWQAGVIERLDAALGLDESQRETVRRELDDSAGRIEAIKSQARKDCRRELIDLHDRIAKILDETQRMRLEKSRQALQLGTD